EGESLVLRTTDGGQTWIGQSTAAPSCLVGVSFVDANNGMTVPRDGVSLLRTTDGGETWTPRFISGCCLGISPLDANDATGGGADGRIAHTIDGGDTWSFQSTGTRDVDLSAVSFVDANTGWAVGGVGTILSTTNGGATWTSQPSGRDRNLYGVSFV